MAKQTWTDERTAHLTGLVEEGVEVTQKDLAGIAEELETSTRSVGSKLRKMGYDVEKVSATNTRKWTPEQESDLVDFLGENPGSYTFREIAALFHSGHFSSKAIQGKILSLELTGSVKPAEKVVAARQYTEEQESVFLAMAKKGDSVEAIAEAMGKSLQSVRGKALSFIRTVEGFKMPHQETSTAASKEDAISGLGDISGMTVEDIASAIDKTPRGVKTSLTRRGLTCADYDGAKRAAKRKD